ESATFDISFAPTGVGTIDGTLTIDCNDSDDTTFTVAVHGDAVGPVISGTAYEDWSSDGTRSPNDQPVVGRDIFLDLNNDGSLDTGQFDYTSTTPVSIFDNSTAFDTVLVSGYMGPIVDVNVTINITHTFDSDLVARLVGPTGITVPLFSNV